MKTPQYQQKITLEDGKTLCVTVKKGHNGWFAETHIDLANQREITLSAAKEPFGSRLRRSATVCTVNDGIATHVISFGQSGDFMKTYAQRAVSRVTDRLVLDELRNWLTAESLAQILAEVEQHYAHQERREAA